jgi:glycerol-3-phosphate acyltransferase PlsY
MIEAFKVLAAGCLAYVLGSISFALLVTRWKAQIDVRTIGSGHATATNTMRAAGWMAGILVMVLDFTKGFLAVWFAQSVLDSVWGAVFAAGMVVIGHCWPFYVGFRGGMGMASGGGALCAIWPLGFVMAVGLGALLQLTVRHSAKANSLTGILLAPLWALFGVSMDALAAAGIVGFVLAIRAASDWRRVYRELWWDRNNKT